MAGEPKEAMNTPLPPNARQPVKEKGIKIYQFSIDRLNEENARYWFHTMEKQLKVQSCWRTIQFYYEFGSARYGSILGDDRDLFKIDLKANSIIDQGLTPATVLEVKDQPNAGSKWDCLKEMFLKSSNTKKAMKLMEMASWTWDHSRLNEKDAFREINQLGEEFIDMNGSEMVSIRELVVIWYLRGLGSQYTALRDTMMSSNATLDKGYVLSRIEDLMQMKGGSAGEKGSRAYNDGKQKKKKKKSKCYVCGKAGHFARECRNKHVDVDDGDQQKLKGQRQGRRGKSSTKQKGRFAGVQSGDDDDDMEEPSSYTVERSEMGQFTSENGNRAISIPSVWRFDSSATSMSAGNKDIFERLDRKSRGILTSASGAHMSILGRGTVKFSLPNSSATVRLNNVIYVPGLTENVLSLEALYAAGFETSGSIKGYTLLKDGKIVAKGKQIGRSTYLDAITHTNALYVKPEQAGKCTEFIGKLDGQMVSQMLSRRAVRAEDDAIDRHRQVIHQRLDHPGRRRFNDCIEALDMDESKVGKRDKLLEDDCEICIKAKGVKSQSRVPVPRARRPLQRVYMNFWGPFDEGIGEERYYLSLIDDCTRHSWVFIKKDRVSSSVQNTLEIWIRQVEQETGKMLSVIQTDNAKEFLALEPWAQLRGIQLEFTESYTPPQNAVAEQFDRFILDVTRALLLDFSVNKKYWKYAVVTANYLRNRTTAVKDRGGKTPYELWHGHKPDLAHLRVWGCRVLYHHKLNDELEGQVMEGTFLMYGKSDKQYAVLPKGVGEIQLVTNPIFHEEERGYLTLDDDSSAFMALMPNGACQP